MLAVPLRAAVFLQPFHSSIHQSVIYSLRTPLPHVHDNIYYLCQKRCGRPLEGQTGEEIEGGEGSTVSPKLRQVTGSHLCRSEGMTGDANAAVRKVPAG